MQRRVSELNLRRVELSSANLTGPAPEFTLRYASGELRGIFNWRTLLKNSPRSGEVVEDHINSHHCKPVIIPLASARISAPNKAAATLLRDSLVRLAFDFSTISAQSGPNPNF
jgi:hypothetical protein